MKRSFLKNEISDGLKRIEETQTETSTLENNSVESAENNSPESTETLPPFKLGKVVWVKRF